MIFAIIAGLAQVLSWMIIARMILGLIFPMGTDKQWVASLMQVLYRVTEPILAPIRRVVYRGGALDFSPMVAVLLLWLITFLFGGLG